VDPDPGGPKTCRSGGSGSGFGSGSATLVLTGETGRPEAGAERKDGKEQVEREEDDHGRWGEGDEKGDLRAKKLRMARVRDYN
jgi:hypothetical protein